tara:strand:+ start:5867 stop:6667 length:801 start_codon:yes stop_codon:yes gene_type:complete
MKDIRVYLNELYDKMSDIGRTDPDNPPQPVPCDGCDESLGFEWKQGSRFSYWVKRQCQTCEDRKRQSQIEQRQLALLQKSGVPKFLHKLSSPTMLSMDAHNDHVAGAVRSWKPPAWLLAVGPVGTGKTSWLTSLFIEQLFTESSFSESLWTTEASLFERADIAHEHHGYTARQNVVAPYITTPMLMIDDLGASRRRLTEWQGSAMRNLFDVRYSNGLPVFITTNLSVKDLINRYGDHIHSRVMSASGGALFVPGRDRRISGSQTDI